MVLIILGILFLCGVNSTITGYVCIILGIIDFTCDVIDKINNKK